MPNTNYPPATPPGFYPHYGRAAADIINTIYDLANREGFRIKAEEAHDKAVMQAQSALDGKPPGSAAVVRVVEVDKHRSPTGNTSPAGKFLVMVESIGDSETKAIDGMLMSAQLRPAGETRSVTAFIKQIDGKLQETAFSLNQLVRRSDELYLEWSENSVESETRSNIAARTALASGNAAEAEKQEATSKSTRQEREQVELDRRRFKEVREKAESGDPAAQKELSDMTDEYDKRSRTAMVSPYSDDSPALPPYVSPFVRGFSPYLELANLNVRSIEIGSELRRQLFNRQLMVSRRGH